MLTFKHFVKIHFQHTNVKGYIFIFEYEINIKSWYTISDKMFQKLGIEMS